MVNSEMDGNSYWRDKSVRDRLGFALKNDNLYKDMEFLVGKNEERISCHKLILRLSSHVFENLITSHEEQGVNEIKLPNITPSAFTRLLKFIYTDELEMYDLLHFLEVARDFGFHKLAEYSIKILKKTEITPTNAVFILDIAKGLADRELEESTLLFILNNAKKVLESDEFVRVSYVGLCQILLEDRLAVDEYTVFKATLRWAEYKCKQSHIPVNGENLRSVVKEARLYIRYTLMGYDQILSEVKPSGLLHGPEFLKVLKYIIDPDIVLLNIPTKPRAFRANLPSRPLQNVSGNNKPSTSRSVLEPVKVNRADVFKLESASMEFKDIQYAIQLRYSVQEIILQDVEIRNLEKVRGKRIYLPNLVSFQFHTKKSFSRSSKLPDLSFMGDLTTKEFLFFEKEKLGSWRLSDLWSLGVEVCLNVKGIRLMDVNPNEKTLTLAYPKIEESDEILKSLASEQDLKSLCLMNCNVNWPDLIQSSSLSTLILQGVQFDNSRTTTDFINQFPSLKYLSVFIENSIIVDYKNDLMTQRNTLVRLALSKVNMGTYKKKKGVIPFSILEDLYFDVCSWPPAMSDQFQTLFPNLKRVGIRSKDKCRPSARLFKEIMDIKTVEEIAIFRYPGKEDSRANPNINIFVAPTGVNKLEVHSFLQSAGVEFDGAKYVPDFIIRKSSETGIWAVVWDVAMSDIHFQHTMLEAFFEDSEVYKMVQ